MHGAGRIKGVSSACNFTKSNTRPLVFFYGF